MDYFGTKFWDTPYWVPNYMGPGGGGGPSTTRYSGVTIVESVRRETGVSRLPTESVYDYEDR